MENYIVSARKYRPATFDNVVGQNALTTTLKNAIRTGRLAHAYLFCGPRGVGKTTCARIFAKTINCLSPSESGEACGKCESCRAFDEGRSYSIHELDAASNNSVEDIRMLIEQVLIPPQVGRYKVFIIDEVHMLSTAAFNAFLKTLEEPPAHAVFILATTEKQKILPTILSRCQIYDFNRMEPEDIVAHLKKVAEQEGIAYEEEALGVIARKADGGMRDALSIFDRAASFAGGEITYKKVLENLGELDYEYYFRLTDLLLKHDIPEVMLTFNEILSKGFDAGRVIGGLAAHFRDLLVSRDERTVTLLDVAHNVKARYSEQATRCSVKFLYRALKLCNTCDINYRTSRNKRLLAELTLIEVAQGEDDAAGSGRRPTKILKPLFVHAAQQAAIAPASQTKPLPQPDPQSAPDIVAKPTTISATTNAAQTRPRRVAHTLSLRRPATKTTDNQNVKDTSSKAEAIKELPETPFKQHELYREWLRFSQSLPQEQKAMAERLKGIEPTLKEDWKVYVGVENKQIVAYMEELKPQLLDFLQQGLKNGKISLHIYQLAENDRRRIYDKKEIYALLLKKNAAFAQLAETLRLELS